MILNWQNQSSASEQIKDKKLHPYIFHEASLTKLIQESCIGEFSIAIHSTGWGKAMPEEMELLDVNQDEPIFVRESWLKSDNVNLVFARSIIPGQSLDGSLSRLTDLGDRPLGEVLFAEPSCERAAMRFARLDESCDLYQHIAPELDNKDDIWVRQSLFKIEHKPLLILEIFLPIISRCMKQSNS